MSINRVAEYFHDSPDSKYFSAACGFIPIWPLTSETVTFAKELAYTDITLESFLSLLRAKTSHDFASKSIDRELSTLNILCDDILPQIRFGEKNYARNLIYKNENFELIALAWSPGQITPVHCHGGERCWMFLVDGEISTQNYLPIRDDKTLPAKAGSASTYSQKGFLYIDDDLGVHSIWNASKRNAISLHLYAAPITQCRIWEKTLGQFAWTTPQYDFHL